MKKMNKVMIAMMMIGISTVMPAMAGNKKHNNDKVTKVVVVNSDKNFHVNKADRFSTHLSYKKPVYHPVVKSCTFRVSRHAAHRNVVARAESIHGVMNAYWNPRTSEITVCYDARKTNARHIMHRVA